MTAGRLIASLATALLVLTGVGYLAAHTVLRRPDLPATPRSAYVAAPTPATRLAEQPGGAPAAPTRVDPRWAASTAARTGVPRAAVRAYADAQLAEPDGCDVGWTTLAGIGWVESHHGTIGGRTLRADGRSSAPVLGPALDGRRFAAIPATPRSTAWHGDPTWDHAVGPLQFIPSTWATWGSDGDGDGSTDPNDLDDAAHAAARYLCADGHDLTTASGWAEAVLSYNHAQAYVDAVYAAATAYAARAR
jgi:hypothetical protein